MRCVYRLLDWLCDLLGVAITFDGDLMAPDPDEAWWLDASDDKPGDSNGRPIQQRRLNTANIQQVANTQLRRRP